MLDKHGKRMPGVNYRGKRYKLVLEIIHSVSDTCKGCALDDLKVDRCLVRNREDLLCGVAKAIYIRATKAGQEKYTIDRTKHRLGIKGEK